MMEIVKVKYSGPCACCGEHCIDVEELRDEDGQYYCLACYVIAEREYREYLSMEAYGV